MKRTEQIKAIIFDLDDTLYPQREYTRQCLLGTVKYLAKQTGRKPELIAKALNEVLEKKGIEYKRIYNDAFKKLHLPDVCFIPRAVKIFWQVKPNLKLFSGTLAVLTTLKKRGYRLGLITDGYPEVQRYKIRNLGLNRIFVRIIYTDLLGFGCRKPSPMPYELMAKSLRLVPSECVYIGNDPRRDFKGAREVGMKTIRIKQGEYRKLKAVTAEEADLSIKSIKDLLRILKGKGKNEKN
ncbi:MAG: HAD family hydrolase [bacterium]|nr:HAD family hydrolase [bacterium]